MSKRGWQAQQYFASFAESRAVIGHIINLFVAYDRRTWDQAMSSVVRMSVPFNVGSAERVKVTGVTNILQLELTHSKQDRKPNFCSCLD